MSGPPWRPRCQPTASRYTRDTAYATLAALGRHIIAGSEGKQPVYRIAHQRLVDYLAANEPDERGGQAGDTAVKVARAVYAVYQELLDTGLAPRAHTYLWRHAWRHLIEGGEQGLDDLRRLVDRDRDAFLPDLAVGLEFAASQAWSAGDTSRALSTQTEAVTLRRTLGEPLRLAMSLFLLSIMKTSAGDDEGAGASAMEAAAISRPLHDTPEGRAVLGPTMTARALAELREGRFRTAGVFAKEALSLAESTMSAGDAGAWRRLAGACIMAAQSAAALNDLPDATRLCERAIRLADESGEPESARDVLLEALSLSATLDFRRAFSTTASADGGFPRVGTAAGERLLAMYRASGPSRTVADIMTARGLMLSMRAQAINAMRGHEGLAWSEITAALDDAISLARAYSAEMPDAALVLAGSLQTRSVLVRATNPDAAAADRAESERVLRRFADRVDMLGVELGIVLNDRTNEEIAALFAGQPVDFAALVNQQKEAVAFLRKGRDWIHRYSLAQALVRLTLLYNRANEVDLEIAAGAESIEVWRELVGMPDAATQLIGCLSDQAARFLESRPIEAADLAEEAVRRANQLPADDPQRTGLLGTSELNLAAAHARLGNLDRSRELLETAIEDLKNFEEHPALAGALANAHSNLALIHVEAGRFADALPHAQHAVELFDRPNIFPLALINRSLALVALGQALSGSGEAARGAAILHDVIGKLVEGVVRDPARDLPRLVAVLNSAGATMWDESLAALADQSDLVRVLRLMRRRPVGEIPVTVRGLLEALRNGPAEETMLVHKIARQHRQLDPARFDTAWQSEAGDLPEWLRLDLSLYLRVIAWWNTPTWALSRDYLQAHPELLAPDTDLVLQELRQEGKRTDLVGRHAALIASARAQGVEAAYETLLAEVSAEEWRKADDLREYLAEHPDLLRPQIMAVLRRDADGGDSAAGAFAAILELAQRGEEALAFEAVEQPASMFGRIQAAWRTADTARLAALAAIVFWQTEEDPPTRHRAAAALAIARSVEQRTADVDRMVAAALEGASAEERRTFVEDVTDAIGHQPASAVVLARLIPMLNGGPAPTV